jgi:UDPglucose 6-dehydrogenase
MRVAVIGAGHVGLVTSAGLASLGHDVMVTDSDRDKMELLRHGDPPFYETGLADLVVREMAAGRLRLSSGYPEPLAHADVVFICVGTPPHAHGEANLLAVERAAIEVARHAGNGTVVVEKSTVPAGTAERIRLIIARERPEARFEIVSNPEFLREGSAIADFLEPDRILVGADSRWAFEVMQRLYEPLTRRGHTLIETDIQTAELAMHACNAFTRAQDLIRKRPGSDLRAGRS